MNEKLIKNIPKEKYFFLEDGKAFKNVEELYQNIEDIDDRVFNLHLYNDDFARWIKDVFKDIKAYDEIIWAKSKKDFKKILHKILYEGYDDEYYSSYDAQKVNIRKKDFKNDEDMQKIVDEDRKNLITEKERIKDEREGFINNQMIYLLNKANDEIALKDYTTAIATLEQAESLDETDKDVKQKLASAKKLLEEKNNLKERKIDFENIEKKSFAEQIEGFNTKQRELKEKMKNLRKEGRDMYIPELSIMTYPAKLYLAEVTRRKEDLKTIKNMLLLCEKEIDEAEKEEVIDVKEEIENGAKKMIDEELKQTA